MVKQALSLPCACGQAITFPEGEIRTVCKTKGCGVVWEIGTGGFWFPISIPLFAPILAKVGKNKPSRYEKYMKHRKENAGRKAGRKCRKEF